MRLFKNGPRTDESLKTESISCSTSYVICVNIRHKRLSEVLAHRLAKDSQPTSLPIVLALLLGIDPDLWRFWPP